MKPPKRTGMLVLMARKSVWRYFRGRIEYVAGDDQLDRNMTINCSWNYTIRETLFEYVGFRRREAATHDVLLHESML